MIDSEELKVSRIMGENESAAKPNRGRHNQGVDRQVAVPTCRCQEVPGDPGDPHPRCHHPGEPAAEHVVDRLIRSCPPVELDEDDRWDAYGVVAALGAPQRGSDPLVTQSIGSGAGERG